jgi:hypothetical protein
MEWPKRAGPWLLCAGTWAVQSNAHASGALEVGSLAKVRSTRPTNLLRQPAAPSVTPALTSIVFTPAFAQLVLEARRSPAPRHPSVNRFGPYILLQPYLAAIIFPIHHRLLAKHRRPVRALSRRTSPATACQTTPRPQLYHQLPTSRHVGLRPATSLAFPLKVLGLFRQERQEQRLKGLQAKV